MTVSRAGLKLEGKIDEIWSNWFGGVLFCELTSADMNESMNEWYIIIWFLLFEHAYMPRLVYKTPPIHTCQDQNVAWTSSDNTFLAFT